MDWKWLVLMVGSFLLGVVLLSLGVSWSSDLKGFLENILVEAIGLFFSLGVVVWLIDGPMLSRERRLRRVLEYKWRPFQRIGDIGSLLARDLAKPLAGEFEPAVDLYGEESASWQDFEPLLREVFRRLRKVTPETLPAYPSVDRESVHSAYKSGLSMVSQIEEVIDSEPKLRGEVITQIGGLANIRSTIDRAERLGLADEPIDQYEILGNIGDRILDLVETIHPLPEGSRPKSLYIRSRQGFRDPLTKRMTKAQRMWRRRPS
jgi:hypothetical protein